MAFIHSSKLVTDSLVVAWDAANPKSYQSGSTTWNDLTPFKHTGSLINNPTYSANNSGYISFNGSTSRARLTFGNNPTDMYAASFTLGAFARQTAPNTADGWLWDVDYVGYRLWGGAGYPFMVRGPAAGWETTTAYSFNLNQWYYVCATFKDDGSANNAKVYINGVLYSSQTFGLKSIGPYAGVSDVGISSHWGGGAPKPYDIAYIHKHNKILSIGEIQQNYNTLKGRFGL